MEHLDGRGVAVAIGPAFDEVTQRTVESGEDFRRISSRTRVRPPVRVRVRRHGVRKVAAV
jgi:hypothetical protein